MRLNPYLAIILGATLGASSGVFIRFLNLPATSFTFFRLMVPVLFVGAFLWYKKVKFFRGNIKMLLLASGINVVRFYLYVLAYMFTTLGNAVVMLFTWPVFASIISLFYLKEKASLRAFALQGLAFLGIIIIYAQNGFSFSGSDFIGMTAMVVSAILTAVMMVIVKKYLTEYSKEESIFYMNFVGAVVLLPLFLREPVPSLGVFSVATLYGFLVGVCAFLFFFYALKRLKMSHYGLFAYWEILGAVLFGFVFFNEPVTWNLVVGGLMIIIAGWLLRRKA